MKVPPFALKFCAFGSRRLKRQFTCRTSLSVRELAVEKESHFGLVANRMELGIDRLMKFPQPPDSLFRHAAWSPDPRSLAQIPGPWPLILIPIPNTRAGYA